MVKFGNRARENHLIQEERSMANITGTVKLVFNSNDTGCAIVHDPVANMDEAVAFWPGPTGAPNNFRLFCNDVLCEALSSGKTVTVTTTTPTSATVQSVQING
jgi:hypothetical protein